VISDQGASIHLPDRREFQDTSAWALDEARSIVRSVLAGSSVKAILFGSRAHGPARPFADLDIALDAGGRNVPPEIWVLLRDRLEESRIPFEVDLVDLVRVPKEWRDAIKREGILWTD
jgi:predicted nucleotidyltransferase